MKSLRTSWRFHALPLAIVLGVALLLRLALWGNLPRLELIGDEGEYLSAATWLAQGRGFAWYQGYFWTRAPLYPLFLAAHLRMFGPGLAPIYVSQTILSLLTVALTYALARQAVAGRAGGAVAGQAVTGRAGGAGAGRSRGAGRTQHAASLHDHGGRRFGAAFGAALACGLYLPLALYPQVLLSEMLFTPLMLGALLALGARAGRDGAGAGGRNLYGRSMLRPYGIAARLIIAGLLLGLATLTRSLVLGFVPLLVIWLLWRRRVRDAVVLAACAAAVVLPWSAYATRLYGGPVIVDTSGAFNLLVGAWTAHDGARRDAPTRDFVLALFPGGPPPPPTCAPHPGPVATQAARQAAMSAEGLCLIRDRPLAFVQKSLAEFVDLLRINYTGAERFTSGFTTGRLSPWYVLALFLLDDTLYIIALVLATRGWGRRDPSLPTPLPRGERGENTSTLIGLWILFNLLVAPLLFAINRFRVPLMPLVFILAAWGVGRTGGVGRTQHAASLRDSGGRGGGRSMLRPYGILAVVFGLAALPSYLGGIPASLGSTVRALETRPRYTNTVLLQEALARGAASAAEALLAGPLTTDAAHLGPALVAAARGDYTAALALLPTQPAGRQLAAVVRGDALRHLGQLDAARTALNPEYVDAANPVEWAWAWLRPAATARIDLAGDLDLGYIRGCYLGEGDPAAQGTFRWCADGAQLRFPGAGTGAPQVLVVRADGRGWPRDMLPVPPVSVEITGQTVGSIVPDADRVDVFMVALPASAPGADVVITLRGTTFVPGPERYRSQQGDQVGQVHRLLVRLDWAEIR